MVDVYEHRLSRFTPTTAVVRLTPFLALPVLVDVVARAVNAGAAIHVVVALLALTLGVWFWRALLRAPTRPCLSVDGVLLDGRNGSVLLDPSDLALWTRGGFGLTLRTQRRLVPALATWHDRERDDVIERFRSAGAEIR